MSQPCCPTCNRPFPKPRAVKPPASVDTAALNLDELRAFYKRIGTREDCRFWLKHAAHVPAEIRVQAEALVAELETRDGRPADAKRLQELKRQAEPFYRQVCGHNHHTSSRMAYACKLGMLGTVPAFGGNGLTPDQNDVIDEAMGWPAVARPTAQGDGSETAEDSEV